MNKIIALTFLVLLQFCQQETSILPVTETYKVISISDGDTFTVLKDKVQTKVRINAIDAPEKGMPFSKVSKQYLSDLCFDKLVVLEVVKTDRYGRSVANVILADGRDVSAEMIKAGLAWHYKEYSNDKNLAQLELNARSEKIGLWQDQNAMAPWEVRKLHRQGISTKEYFKNAK